MSANPLTSASRFLGGWETPVDETPHNLYSPDDIVEYVSQVSFLGQGAFNVMDPTYGAKGTGVVDDRAAFVAAQAACGSSGRLFVPPGTYRIASDLTITSAMQLDPGAQIAPDSGVTVTINNTLQAPLTQIFGGTGVFLIGRGRINALYPEWWGASNGAAGSVNRAACQAAICTSLGVKSIAAALIAQPTLLYAPVVLSSLYPVDGSIYCPRYTHLRGISSRRRFGFSATANNVNILVLGRQLLETDWIDITLEDLDIEGSVSATGQVGIKAQFSGAGGYVSPLTLRNVKITNVGGIGVDLLGDSNSMIVQMFWDRVEVGTCNSNVVHTKIGIFNQPVLTNCYFHDSGNGWFSEDDGSLSNTIETFRASGCVFESLGADVVGGYAFKSSVFDGQFEFDDCYFEGNGNNAADTTGAHVWVRQPWMLKLQNCLLASSNNLLWMQHGGQASLDGCYLSMGVSSPTAVFTIDNTPTASRLSNVEFGRSVCAGAYTEAQMVRRINGATTATTSVTGFTDGGANYVATPARLHRDVYRDGRTQSADDGAIGYNAVKRLTNNADGTTLVVTGGIATICLDTIFVKILISESYSTATMAEFLLTAGGGIALIGQRGTVWTTTKDNALTLNVYHDAGLGAWVVQNKLATSATYGVRFIGVEPMGHADDGYYETQFA